MEQLVIVYLRLKGCRLGRYMGHRIFGGVIIIALFGAHMVDNSVNNNLQTELMRLFAHGNELGFGAQSVIGAVVELETRGLIEHPPTVLAVVLQKLCAFGTLLDLVGGRYLNGGEALLGDGLKIRFDILERPGPCLQDGTVIYGLRKTVIVFHGCLSQHIFICGARAGYVNVRGCISRVSLRCRGSNDADRKNGQYHSEC